MVVQSVLVRGQATPDTGNFISLLARRRFQYVAALFVAALLPYFIRSLTFPGAATDPPNVNAFLANVTAITIANRTRLPILTQ